jgi:hypothetical protein
MTSLSSVSGQAVCLCSGEMAGQLLGAAGGDQRGDRDQAAVAR